jgi:hypothetical protein
LIAYVALHALRAVHLEALHEQTLASRQEDLARLAKVQRHFIHRSLAAGQSPFALFPPVKSGPKIIAFFP